MGWNDMWFHVLYLVWWVLHKGSWDSSWTRWPQWFFQCWWWWWWCYWFLKTTMNFIYIYIHTMTNFIYIYIHTPWSSPCFVVFFLDSVQILIDETCFIVSLIYFFYDNFFKNNFCLKIYGNNIFLFFKKFILILDIKIIWKH